MERPANAGSARRSLFTRTAGLRPPWTDETRIKSACTSCGACITSCPEGILVAGPGKTPMVNFAHGECTFCGACVEACAEPVFSAVSETPWSAKASVGDGCLNALGISCQLCTDACDTRALRLDMSVRPVGAIRVDTAACTGCGACVSACPEAAIGVAPGREPAHV